MKPFEHFDRRFFKSSNTSTYSEVCVCLHTAMLVDGGRKGEADEDAERRGGEKVSLSAGKEALEEAREEAEEACKGADVESQYHIGVAPIQDAQNAQARPSAQLGAV
ncbi:hypothetical protein NDU88_006083 [Pleurodeles waltl]|uniref:Uncharacterized protein n=1 Tax=Pleurodeles waltl TaxID=8319 RepID=A0AAV7VPT4_PLEWA|nr:hypothetical protein NDU88_006083 [Pleurodeles waltl]